MKYLIPLILAVVFLCSCATQDKRITPPLQSEGFQGITYMSVDRMPLGPDDPNDWQLHSGYSEMGIYPKRPGNDLYEVPEGYWVSPAYPNPATSVVCFSIGVPKKCEITVWAVSYPRQVVEHFSCEQDSGGVTFCILSGHNYVIPLSEGIYRVIYTIKSLEDDDVFSGYGDVYITAGNKMWLGENSIM